MEENGKMSLADALHTAYVRSVRFEPCASWRTEVHVLADGSISLRDICEGMNRYRDRPFADTCIAQFPHFNCLEIKGTDVIYSDSYFWEKNKERILQEIPNTGE